VLRSYPRGTIATSRDFFVLGNRPVAMVAADFNKDSLPDLAVVNRDDDDVTLLWGNGDGTFNRDPNDLPVADAPEDIVAGYFDDDDVLDLVISSNAGSALTVWHGATPSGGSFVDREDLPIGNATSLVAGYFDSDGRMDVACIRGETVTILLGLPGGSLDWANPDEYALLGEHADDITAADLNRDGRPDLATVNISGTVSVLYAQPDGSFGELGEYEALPGSGKANWIGAGDLNVDGLIDIIASWTWTISPEGQLAVLFALPGGGFTDPVVHEIERACLGRIAVEDFDRDTFPDATIADTWAQHVFFSDPNDPNNGPDPEAFVAHASQTVYEALAVADFDRDGRPDVARTGVVGGEECLTIMLNTSTAKIRGDLAVTSLSAPSKGLSGQVVTVGWTVQNQLDTPITGKWTDAVYLSLDAAWDINDIRMTTLDFLGDLAPYGEDGDSYSQSLEVALPGVLPKPCFVLVRTDATDQVAELTGEIDNVMASPIDMDLPELPICEPDDPCPGIDDYFDEQRRALYYELQVRAAEDLLITLDALSDEGINELYIRYNAVPSRSRFDAKYQNGFAADQTVRIPGTEEGTHYLLAYADQLPMSGPAPFNLKAEYLPLAVTGITPNRGGNTGRVTATLEGSGFTPGTEVSLSYMEDGVPHQLTPRRTEIADQGLMRVTFDLRDIAPITCDLSLDRPEGGSVELPDAFVVEPGRVVPLDLRVSGLTAWRRGSSSTFDIEITNNSNVDAQFVTVTIWPPDYPNVTVLVEHPPGDCGECVQVNPRVPFLNITPGETVSVRAKASFSQDFNSDPKFVVEVRTTEAEDVLAKLDDSIEPFRQYLLEHPPIPPDLEPYIHDPDLFRQWFWGLIEASGLFDEDLLRDGPRDAWCTACLASAYTGCAAGTAALLLELELEWAHIWWHVCDEWAHNNCAPVCDDDTPDDTPCASSGSVAANGTVSVGVCLPEAGPSDPNEKVGPAGWGEERFVPEDYPIHYTVRFENLPEAAAAAWIVDVTDQLSTDFDWTTLALDEIAFGETVLQLPDALTHFEGRLVEAGCRPLERTLRWIASTRALEKASRAPVASTTQGHVARSKGSYSV
jgi:hypothetical protein